MKKIQQFVAYLKANPAQSWFWAAVVTGFVSAISFFQINSYAADKFGLNGAWVVSGIVFALAAAYCGVKVSKNSN